MPLCVFSPVQDQSRSHILRTYVLQLAELMTPGSKLGLTNPSQTQPGLTQTPLVGGGWLGLCKADKQLSREEFLLPHFCRFGRRVASAGRSMQMQAATAEMTTSTKEFYDSLGHLSVICSMDRPCMPAWGISGGPKPPSGARYYSILAASRPLGAQLGPPRLSPHTSRSLANAIGLYGVPSTFVCFEGGHRLCLLFRTTYTGRQRQLYVCFSVQNIRRLPSTIQSIYSDHSSRCSQLVLDSNPKRETLRRTPR